MNIYTPQPNDILAPGSLVAGVQNQMQGFLAACGEFAGAVFAAIQTGGKTSATYANGLVGILHAQRLADPQGTTSLTGLATGLTETGIPSTVVDNWRQAISGFIGRSPVVLLFQNAQALPGETPGLQGHFATVVGFSPSTNKFVVADPNSPASKVGGFSLYSLRDLARANPAGAIVPAAMGGGPTPPTSDGSVPPGWTQEQWQAYQDFLRRLYTATPASVAGDVTSQAISGGLRAAGNALIAAWGAHSTTDLTFRIVLIVAGWVLILGSIFALLSGAVRDTASTAAKAAPLVAAAA